MIVDDTTECPKCKHPTALTHYSSCGLINWIACPKCRTFYDHWEEKAETDEKFWENVERDVGYNA